MDIQDLSKHKDFLLKLKRVVGVGVSKVYRKMGILGIVERRSQKLPPDVL